ncbi:DUF6978 family protein [Candidatus Trichorickettsia mobilis]|jgi:hypothetical protein|uniref:DUF6978 family protein n=1 Tax=Candidatus Trichorickettsia mobilis TaxID=1346319 RepID=UPI00292E232D|nr:hypothetical protein [Candidatus Trichorickettsia mobilis]
MTQVNITQDEADSLFKMEKIKIDDNPWGLPDLGGKIEVPLISVDKREHFMLDISRGKINLKRQKYQNRARDAIILARLDLGSPHRNPNGEEIGIPHLHLYREGYGDKWAFTIPDNIFQDINDFWQTLHDFMRYCKIIEVPNFSKGLFS